MVDFQLLVARFSSATPAIAADNTLRELRIDAGGRVYSRLADDRDVAIRYFHDGESVDASPNLDKGILILGKNDTDSNYQALRVLNDGSLSVSFNAGTDISEASDSSGGTYTATDSEGEVALVIGNWVLVQSIAVPSGTLFVDGWSYASDKNAIFQLCMVDDTAQDNPTRADVIEILDSHITTSARPSDHVSFDRALTKAGGADIYVAVFAKQLQSGATGVGLSMINAHTAS